MTTLFETTVRFIDDTSPEVYRTKSKPTWNEPGTVFIVTISDKITLFFTGHNIREVEMVEVKE